MADATPLTTSPIDASALRKDGWENLLTGAADKLRDKREHSRARARLMSYEEAHALYRGVDMAARIVDRHADEMTRKWIEVKVESTKAKGTNKADADKAHELAEALDTKLDELGAQSAVNKALRWKRAYGGAGILIGANDGAALGQLKDPLREDAIRSIDYLNVFDCRELVVVDYYSNPLAANYGEPKTYQLNPRAFGLGTTLGVVYAHESRILRFCGDLARRDDTLYNNGWGDSVLAKTEKVLRDFDLSWDSASALLQDFAQAVFKIKGLADAVASDREGTVIKRLQLMDLARSYLRGIALDAEHEDFERKPTPIAGLSDLLVQFCNRLAAAADMPVSMLMGQAPGGLNATGQENTRYFYDRIESQQNNDLRPVLNRLVKLIMLSKQGPSGGAEPEVWSIAFRPLWQLDDQQKADSRSKNAMADQVYLSNGVVTPEEVARSRFGGDEYGTDIRLDRDTRDAYDNAPEIDPQLDPSEDPSLAPAPATAPGAVPVQPAAPAGADKAQDTALNGAQVTSALEIVEAVAEGRLPRDTGVNMLVAFFNLDPVESEKIMGTVGKGFKPTPPPAAAPATAPATGARPSPPPMPRPSAGK